jgi:glycosyltransferase involved in cell wall biosynthesis
MTLPASGRVSKNTPAAETRETNGNPTMPDNHYSPGISVAMCTYNGERFLSAQLESIAAQTIRPLELVVSDDGSTDKTMEILEHFAQHSEFPVRIFQNERNLGYVRNFEVAITKSRGDLIALSDQDDIWYSDKLASLRPLFVDDLETGGVFSNGNIIREDGSPTGQTLWRAFGFQGRDQSPGGRSYLNAEVLLRGNVVTGMTLMFRAKFRSLLLPVPAGWHHDGWFAWMLCLHSKLAFWPQPLVAYRTHSTQQIGAPAHVSDLIERITSSGVRAYLERAKSKSLSFHETAELQFTTLANYMELSALSPALIERVRQAAAHARAIRFALSRDRSQRFFRLIPYAYQHYGLSLRGMCRLLRDMVV